MKKILLVILLVVILVAVAGTLFIRSRMRTDLALNAKMAVITDKVDAIRSSAIGFFNDASRQARRSVKNIKNISPLTKRSGQSKESSRQIVKITLKHGNIIEGPLISKSDKEYIVDWKGEEFAVSVKQAAKIEYPKEIGPDWTYKNSVVVKKTNGIDLDGEITAVGPDSVTMVFREGGGDLEMTLARSEIAYLMFAPVVNRDTLETESRLRQEFPKMKFYKEGNFMIVTDSYVTWVNQYKRAVRDEYTQIYLNFFKLFKAKKSLNQNYIVIFDSFNDYAEYALTDGVPFWAVVGYFKPTDKVLYLFNAFGEEMEKIVFEVMVGKTGRSIDQIVGSIKKQADSRRHVFIDGQVKEFTDKIWDTYSLYKNELTEITFSTLRHEFTHEVFCNWALQSVVLSMPDINKDKLLKKKKEFLETKDWKRKEALLMGLMKMTHDSYEDVEIEGAHSWLAEGIATYCETEPFGSYSGPWLFIYQEMIRKNTLNPIEFLTNFKMGSFPGLCSQAMMDSYAESWAFVSFLMAKYPDSFLDYQAGVIGQKASATDELGRLLKCLNKDLPSIEKEFKEYMASYEPVDDPDVERFMEYHKIWGDVLSSG